MIWGWRAYKPPGRFNLFKGLIKLRFFLSPSYIQILNTSILDISFLINPVKHSTLYHSWLLLNSTRLFEV